MTLTPLFDLGGWSAEEFAAGLASIPVLPSIHSTFGDDSPRTRKTDPLTSHRAGDKSAENLTAVKRAVIALVRAKGTLTGSQANIMYRDMAQYPANGLPMVAWDSPRKRLGELAVDGLLVALNPDHLRGTETVYALPDRQQEAVA